MHNSKMNIQVQRDNLYLPNGLEVNNLKAFETPSIFTISGNSLNSRVELVDESENDDENDGDSDVVSELIGHIGPWQLFWAIIMCLYQFPTTFHIFCLVFQVSFSSVRFIKTKWNWWPSVNELINFTLLFFSLVYIVIQFFFFFIIMNGSNFYYNFNSRTDNMKFFGCSYENFSFFFIVTLSTNSHLVSGN